MKPTKNHNNINIKNKAKRVPIAMCIDVSDSMNLIVDGFDQVKNTGRTVFTDQREYEVVEGTCVGIVPKMLGRYRKIKIMDDEANESTLLLDKQSKIKIGDRYRFYFKKTTRVTLGNEYFDSALSSDCFLGYEVATEIN